MQILISLTNLHISMKPYHTRVNGIIRNKLFQSFTNDMGLRNILLQIKTAKLSLSQGMSEIFLCDKPSGTINMCGLLTLCELLYKSIRYS